MPKQKNAENAETQQKKPRAQNHIMVFPDKSWAPAGGERVKVPSWLARTNEDISNWVDQGCPSLQSAYQPVADDLTVVTPGDALAEAA